MSELKRTVTPFHEYDPGRQLFEFKKFGAGDDVLLTRNLELYGLRSCSNVDILAPGCRSLLELLLDL